MNAKRSSRRGKHEPKVVSPALSVKARNHSKNNLIFRTNINSGIFVSDRVSVDPLTKNNVFAKGMPHVNGVVTDETLQDMKDRLFLNPKFVNPSAGNNFSMLGPATQQFVVPVPPSISSKEEAINLVELYCMAWCRDIPFSNYETDQRILLAVNFLNDAGLDAPAVPSLIKGLVSPNNIFRVLSTPGHYVSQFLLKTFKFGNNVIVPTCKIALPNVNFLKDRESFENTQNGIVQTAYEKTPDEKFIYSGRALLECVHFDNPADLYHQALYILMQEKVPIVPNLGGEKPFVDLNCAEIMALLSMGTHVALQVCWYNKWNVHVRARPDYVCGILDTNMSTPVVPTGKGCEGCAAALASLGINLDSPPKQSKVESPKLSVSNKDIRDVNVSDDLTDDVNVSDVIEGNDVNVSDDLSGGDDLTVSSTKTARGPLFNPVITESEILKITHRLQGNYLLSSGYPEGSPFHPSYPAGHATIAGCAVTILKAFFKNEHALTNCVMPLADGSGVDAIENTIVADELDKLADNISMGRNWAGIHDRADALVSLKLGERIAIELLKDTKKRFDDVSFTLRRFDGSTLVI